MGKSAFLENFPVFKCSIMACVTSKEFVRRNANGILIQLRTSGYSFGNGLRVQLTWWWFFHL